MSLEQRRDLEENKMNMNIPPQPHITTTQTNMTTTGVPIIDVPITTTGVVPTTTNYPQEVTGTSSLSPDDQDYWYYCWRHSYIPVESNVIPYETTTVTTKQDREHWKYEKNNRHQKKMDTLICNSYDMLKEYFDPNLYPNHRIPYDLFQSCRGIIFLRIWKAGIFVGGIGGTGIVLAHSNGQWSNPCAISIGGVQLGLQLGVERVDDILLLHDDAALKLLFERGHFKLGADASIAVGPYGRDANVGVAMSGKDSKSIYSYSFAKGAFIGLSLDGGSITANDTVNEEFYGRKLSMKDTFFANIDIPKNDDFWRLKQLLNDYSVNQMNINQRPIVTNDTNINPIANQ